MPHITLIRQYYLTKGTEFPSIIIPHLSTKITAFAEGIRGFIPASQLSLDYVEDPDTFVGKTLEVRVITVDKEKERLPEKYSSGTSIGSSEGNAVPVIFSFHPTLQTQIGYNIFSIPYYRQNQFPAAYAASSRSYHAYWIQ